MKWKKANWNPYRTWERYHFENLKDAKQLWFRDNPVVGGGDTETTGLHIKKDKPFLGVFGWLKGNSGVVLSFNITPNNLRIFNEWQKRLKQNWYWNCKYDLHMLANMGFPYEGKNLYEGMSLARAVLEALPARLGGDKLRLKEIGPKYVHYLANRAEEKIKEIAEQINKERVMQLKVALKQFPLTEEIKKETGAKSWTKGILEDLLKDPAFDEMDLPEGVREVYKAWIKKYPLMVEKDPEKRRDYKAVYEQDPKAMITYAQDDVITMLEFVRSAWGVLIARKQMPVLERESKCILPLYRMERAGIALDREYLEQSRVKLKTYIQKKRNYLAELAGQSLKPSQGQRIAKVLMSMGVELPMTDKGNPKVDKKVLKDVARKYTGTPREIALTINRLRTLEKWYTTYCTRLLQIAEHDGRYYTQIMQSNAVSGRVGSDSQQFPKDPIKDDEGNELFHPRHAFTPTHHGRRQGYTAIYYLDFSQIELRNQADYTIRVMSKPKQGIWDGDLNLCRSYMPFKCVHYKSGEQFRFDTVEHRSRWNEMKEGCPDLSTLVLEDGETKGLEAAFKLGWSAWIVPETGEPWVPTDAHSETTHNLLVATGYSCLEKYKSYEATAETQPQAVEFFGTRNIDVAVFKKLRRYGKTFNFMANYGGTKKAAMQQLDLPEVIAEALVKAYYTSFPGVNMYQRAVMDTHASRGYVFNRYGRRYYLSDISRSYTLANYLVQGTATGDLMKECIIKIDELLTNVYNVKSRMLLTVHDELQFEIWSGEEWLIPEIKKIMEDHPWHLVPIIADVEKTTTHWANKEDV